MWLSGMPGTKVKTASGSVPASGTNGVRIYHVHIISGATAGVLKLYDGNNASGTLIAQLTCATVSTGNNFNFGTGGLYFPRGCWAEEVVDADISSVTYSLTVEEGGELGSTSSSSSSCRSSSSSCSSSSSSCRSSSSSSFSSSSSSKSSSSSSCSSSSSSCRSSSSSSSSVSSSSSSSSSSCRSSSSSSANP